MSSPTTTTSSVQAVDPAAKPTRRTFTNEYRNKIIDEYAQAPHGEKSAVLRREGLYQSQLREWVQARKGKDPGGRSSRSRESGGDARHAGRTNASPARTHAWPSS